MSEHQPIWGQHLIIDLAGCPRDRLIDADHLRSWVKDLVETIKMKAYGEPQLEHFATHSYDAAGYTLLQLIETSNICAHFAENLGQVYIDIF
ncbi:MAG: S-adenosylmethionine decarboxylase, partial [Gammaproteobacteria bacterium]